MIPLPDCDLTPGLKEINDHGRALERQLGVLPNLYNAGFWHVLWVRCDVTQDIFGNMLGGEVAKRLKVPL
jgi:hypothetical protein